jgi:hypothetical protein
MSPRLAPLKAILAKLRSAEISARDPGTAKGPYGTPLRAGDGGANQGIQRAIDDADNAAVAMVRLIV